MKKLLGVVILFFALCVVAPAQAQTVGDILKNKSKEAGEKAKDKAKDKAVDKVKKKGRKSKAAPGSGQTDFSIGEKGDTKTDFTIGEKGDTKTDFTIGEKGDTKGQLVAPSSSPAAPADTTKNTPQVKPAPVDTSQGKPH
jgi:hypothetical protein